MKDPQGKVGHKHADVAGGQLRAATFGAMDGLVTNLSLVAGVGAAGVGAHTIVLSGVAGLAAGAFSMAMGEYTSVSIQNEQVAAEVRVERKEFRRNPEAEQKELSDAFVDLGMRPQTATDAAAEIHRDTDRAINFHLTQELGVDPQDRPSPWVAAISSFVMFCIGGSVPLLPYFLGFDSLFFGLGLGAIGLVLTGALTAYITSHSMLRGALRQLAFGVMAAGATYFIGWLIGSPV